MFVPIVCSALSSRTQYDRSRRERTAGNSPGRERLGLSVRISSRGEKMRKMKSDRLIAALFLLAASGWAVASQDAAQRSKWPTVPELWERCQETLPPFSYEVLKDEIIPSYTDPSLQLRRMEIRYTSMVVGQWGRRMTHTGTVFMPADPRVYQTPDRKGKVVVVAGGFQDHLIIDNYGEPIAARTGYPTMVIPVPGEYDGHNGESCWMNFFRLQMIDTQDPVNHAYFRMAIGYIRALDAFADILGEKNIRAVIGGHSKRAQSAFNAAAMDPVRIAGVVYMGMETVFSGYENKIQQGISPIYSQEFVKCPVFYIGTSNEDGYKMFNINTLQDKMRRPWTIEYIPNFHHATYSEIQIMDWMMWISYIHEGRALTRISNLATEENAEGTWFRCRIDTPNRILQAKIFYVYCDDVPYWRDLMWYPSFLSKKGDGYETFVPGKLPDAWIVEVKDTANGFPGYVSSLPQDITHLPTEERYSRGWRSRNWEPKYGKEATKK